MQQENAQLKKHVVRMRDHHSLLSIFYVARAGNLILLWTSVPTAGKETTFINQEEAVWSNYYQVRRHGDSVHRVSITQMIYSLNLSLYLLRCALPHPPIIACILIKGIWERCTPSVHNYNEAYLRFTCRNYILFLQLVSSAVPISPTGFKIYI